jgi:hypothetical protein
MVLGDVFAEDLIHRTLASLQTLDRSISPSLPKLAATNRLDSSDVLIMGVHIVTSTRKFKTLQRSGFRPEGAALCQP